jgi:hypothetical protein
LAHQDTTLQRLVVLNRLAAAQIHDEPGVLMSQGSVSKSSGLANIAV